MNKTKLTNDTIIEIGKSITLSKYREYFQKATGKDLSGAEFQPWLNLQAGKTVKEAIPLYCEATERKDMKEIMKENRFAIITEENKKFIIAFDKEIEMLGYDFGGGIGDGYCWGKYMIIYSKMGVKTKSVAARIFIRENSILLRMFFNNIDKHRNYIESAPKHIKEVFTGNHGGCSCNPKKDNCRMRKTYTIDDKLIEKCSGIVFEFKEPTIDNLNDYINLFKEFYPPKRVNTIK